MSHQHLHVATLLPTPRHAALNERLGDLSQVVTLCPQGDTPRHLLVGVQAVVVIGSRGLGPYSLDDFPALQLICVTGAGYDGVDAAAALARGVHVSHGPGTNTECVADHALMLMLAAGRRLKQSTAVAERTQLHRKNVGIVGMGAIGQAVARRLSGFDCSIAWHGPRAKPGLHYTFEPDLLRLAGSVDYLVLTCPANATTYHLVDGRVLAALGQRGVLVNVARGSVVETPALLSALETGVIGAAGLDVIEDEPLADPSVLALENLVYTPHVAPESRESQALIHDLVLQNFTAFFSRGELITPIYSPAGRVTDR